MADTRRFRIAVLISGGGTTLRNILRRIDAGDLAVEVGLVVSSTAKAGGLAFAEDAGIPHRVVRRKEHDTVEAFSDAIFGACREHAIDLVVMGGFLKRVTIPRDFEGRVINIHPALIPAFSGHGFYGHRVHEAALEHGVKVSGCTVHYADDEYDHGPVIAQRAVPVHEDDTPETLAARVFEAECDVYPEVIGLIAAGRVHRNGRRVRVDRGRAPDRD